MIKFDKLDKLHNEKKKAIIWLIIFSVCLSINIVNIVFSFIDKDIIRVAVCSFGIGLSFTMGVITIAVLYSIICKYKEEAIKKLEEMKSE